jgi:hypothetical protein
MMREKRLPHLKESFVLVERVVRKERQDQTMKKVF